MKEKLNFLLFAFWVRKNVLVYLLSLANQVDSRKTIKWQNRCLLVHDSRNQQKSFFYCPRTLKVNNVYKFKSVFIHSAYTLSVYTHSTPQTPRCVCYTLAQRRLRTLRTLPRFLLPRTLMHMNVRILKVKYENTAAMSVDTILCAVIAYIELTQLEITCSKLTIETLEQTGWVFIKTFNTLSHFSRCSIFISLVFWRFQAIYKWNIGLKCFNVVKIFIYLFLQLC